MGGRHRKLKKLFLYTFFGICTTIINSIVFHIASFQGGLHYMLSNLIAWSISIAFAFVTNKSFVFDNSGWKKEIWLKEAINFLGARLLTGVLDMLGMYVLISLLMLNEDLSKIVVNLAVIVMNYFFSKLWVFSKLGDRKVSEINEDTTDQ